MRSIRTRLTFVFTIYLRQIISNVDVFYASYEVKEQVSEIVSRNSKMGPDTGRADSKREVMNAERSDAREIDLELGRIFVFKGNILIRHDISIGIAEPSKNRSIRRIIDRKCYDYFQTVCERMRPSPDN